MGKDIIFDIKPECFWFVYNSQNGTSLKLSYIFPFSNSCHQEKRSIVACRASIQMDWFARILIIEILVGMNLKRHFLPLDTGCKLTVMLRRHPGPLLNGLCTFNLRPLSMSKAKASQWQKTWRKCFFTVSKLSFLQLYFNSLWSKICDLFRKSFK